MVEFINLKEHTDYIAKLIDNKIQGSEDRIELKKRLDQIVEKNNDKLLNMSVIGEFSTGKSTFINALVRTELLSSCALQGTTVANTVIEYDDSCCVRVSYRQEKRVEGFTYNSVTEMKNKIDSLTTDPVVARELSTVFVSLPAQNIKNNFRIIDTPGTNALESWHEEVTQNALRNISDISIILVDSSKPFPQTLCNFIKENLSEVVTKCVFVMTKIDTVNQKERNMLLSYAEKKIRTEFGLEAPVVIPYSATAVLEGDDENELYRLSVESEKQLVSYMAKQKNSAQASKLIELVDRLYGTLEQNMKSTCVACDAMLERLEKSRQIDLAVFNEEQKNIHSKKILTDSEEVKEILTNCFYNFANEAIEVICAKIDACNNTEEIKRYVDGDMSNDYERVPNLIMAACEEGFADIDESYYSAIKLYEESFTRYFRNMNLLTVDSDSIAIAMGNSEANAVVSFDGNDTVSYLSEQIKKENNVALGGATAGAALGTVLFPGVGTIVGGILGGLFGLFTNSIENVRKDTKNKIHPKLISYFEAVKDQFLLHVNKKIEQTVFSMKKYIDTYSVTYKRIVDERITDEQARKKALEEKKRGIESDLLEISTRKGELISKRRIL